MSPVRVQAPAIPGTVRAASRITAGMLTTGAKSEVVNVAGMSANLSEKSGRQIFAEVPGVFVYDMDGSGNQVNISTRGLDPHRSWEFNVRQNGVLTVSDGYGYPASHYSAPMEAIERIELIRGTAALQYGMQFGGLLNYVIKSPDTSRAMSVESRSSVGSNGLASTWNAAGGRIGRLTYYAYAAVRRADGYRANGSSLYDAEFLSASIPLTPQLKLRAEAGRSWYRYRLPGPLTDRMFEANARSSTRSRNWYSPDIIVPSMTLTWTPSTDFSATLLASGVFGTRSSVAVGGFATAADTATTAGTWSTRQVDVDRYVTRSVELRLHRDWMNATVPTSLAAGLAYSDNDMHRRQQGVGSRGSDYSLDLEPGGDFKRDLHYRTRNLAAFAESELRVTSRWTLVPGIRVESGATHMTGRLAYYDEANTPRDIIHRFPLFGARSSLMLPAGAEWYSGWSQAYRPMILKDVLPETATERTDTNLRDARGWTVESGVRGDTRRGLSYDIAAFTMRYANRFGSLTVTDASGTPYTYKTNVGTTRTTGLEARLSSRLGTRYGLAWRAFTATALMDARYARGSVVSVGRNVDISGNDVESAPRLLARAGLSARGNAGDIALQVSRVSRTYADALNTGTPGANGATGIVPAYSLVDLNFTWNARSRLAVSGGISNLFDRRYFTKRPQFYPGPGVWPSDGRSLQFSLSLRPSSYR